MAEDFKIYNPFAKFKDNAYLDLDHSKEIEFDKNQVDSFFGYTCDACRKEFSDEKFVEFHKKIFHGGKSNTSAERKSNKVQMKYIDSCEEMMISFHRATKPEGGKTRAGNKTKSNKCLNFK